MLAALSMPSLTPAQRAERNAAIAEARAIELSIAANRPVSPAVVSRVDSLLGLPPTNPTLGVTR